MANGSASSYVTSAIRELGSNIEWRSGVRYTELMNDTRDLYVAERLDQGRDSAMEVTQIAGGLCRSVDSLFDEFAQKVPFPDYFGRNWAAFSECLSEREPPSKDWSWTVVINDANQLLADAALDAPALLRCLEHACDAYSQPIADGEWWDRPAIQFRVVFLVDNTPLGPVLDHWVKAGRVKDSRFTS